MIFSKTATLIPILATVLLLLGLGSCINIHGDMKYLTIEPGMTMESIRRELGPADSSRELNNNSPEKMGERVYTYHDPSAHIEFILQNGTIRTGSLLELVSDPKGNIIRLTQNPNPLDADTAKQPVQRGLPGYVVRTRMPLQDCKI